ncbi:MAG: hypothetical protein ACK4P3_06545 [Fimbriimonadaceae bacterium]
MPTNAVDLIQVWVPDAPGLEAILARHPHVSAISVHEQGSLCFGRENPSRCVRPGFGPGIRGLIEIIDNNPLVCTDEAWVPVGADTCALIALSPLALTGLIAAAPALVSTSEFTSDLPLWLTDIGIDDPVAVQIEPMDLGTVVAVTALVAVRQELSVDQLRDMYAERYEGSFFVHEARDSWDTSLVAGTASAYYDLSVTPGDGDCLVKIRVIADANGKCGAAALIHMMNVMCGFEESLGVS